MAGVASFAAGAATGRSAAGEGASGLGLQGEGLVKVPDLRTGEHHVGLTRQSLLGNSRRGTAGGEQKSGAKCRKREAMEAIHNDKRRNWVAYSRESLLKVGIRWDVDCATNGSFDRKR